MPKHETKPVLCHKKEKKDMKKNR